MAVDIIKVIQDKIRENKLSHAYLIETNNIENTRNKIKKIVKMLECPKTYNDKCSDCAICNLIDKSNMPSLIFINPDGMSIKKEAITNLIDSFGTKPVIAKYNIYIINEADKLNASSSNALLKFLEEPDDDIIGFLLTNSVDKMLPTITSRCQIFYDMYDEKTSSSVDEKKLADKLFNCSMIDILNNKDIADKIDRNSLIKVFEEMIVISRDSIKKDYCKKNINKLSIIRKILEKIRFNVNIELLLDEFVIEMSELNEKNI